MSDSRPDEDLASLTAELVGSLRDLQRELEPGGRPRLPTPRDLLRFTDEVAIPGLVLVLETNIRALRLLQRTIRLAEGREPGRDSGGPGAGGVRDRAADLSRATLERLDEVLVDLREAVEGRPDGDEARRLLEEVESLRAEMDERLADAGRNAGGRADVPVDVEAELRSIKDDIDGPGDPDESGNSDGPDR